MKTIFKNISISPIWMYRIVRWFFGLIFVAIGVMYEDAWAAFIFGGLFIITSFFTPHQCVGGECKLDHKAMKKLKDQQ